MSRFDEIRAQARRQKIADSEARLRLPRPRQRLDSGLGFVLICTALTCTAGAFLLASWLDVSGYMDPPLVATIEDPRILADYRDTPSPMVDLVAQGDDLLIGRQDGSIDRFASRDRLFSSETLPRGPAFSGDLNLLSVDCDGGGCQEGQSATAFALTEKGGLARQDGRGWQVVLGDMAFIGADGVPVEQEDLRGWAVSDDGKLVLLDAGEKGLGLFDQTNGFWRSGPPIQGVTQGPLFSGGAFWMGSGAGMHRVFLSGSQADWGTRVLPGTEGEILDLAPGPDAAGLLVLRRGGCDAGGTGCLSLLSVEGRGVVSPLMQEIEAHPDLNDAGLKHVVMQGRDLIVLGTAGVHRYEAAARRWRLIDPQEPTAWFAGAGGEPFHIALPDRVLSFTAGQEAASIALEAPLNQILPGAGRDLYGLDRQGRILSLGAQSASVIAPADPGAPSAARFTTALALDKLFVALGPHGVLVHDTASRRYSFVPSQRLPPLPLENGIALAGADGRIWLVSRADGGVWSLTLSGDFPDKDIAVEAHGAAGFPVAQVRPQGNSVELIGRDGQVARLAPGDGFAPLAGNALPGPFSPVSVAVSGTEYLFTDGDDIWAYRSDRRGWLGSVPAPQERELTDLIFSSGGLLGLDTGGMVHARGEDGWAAVAGGPQLAAFESSDLQDAMALGEVLYLASDAQVQSYLPSLRRFDRVWTGAGRGAEILGASGGQPLWTTSAGLWRGNDRLFGGTQFRDGWVSHSGPVAMAQAPGRPLYLAGPGGCLYLGHAAPKGEIRDVVQLDAERLLVRSTSGAGIYEARLHRWLDVDLPGMDTDSRLTRLGEHLVRLDPAGLASIPISDIPVVDSCAAASVEIAWQIDVQGRHASLVDGAPEILLLAETGEVAIWREGQFVREMVASGGGPRMELLLRAWPDAGGILAATGQALWRYDLGTRSWKSWRFSGGPRDVSQIDLSPERGWFTLTLWDARGAAWGGYADLKQGDIALTPLKRPVLPRIAVPPDEIHDISVVGNRIAVLSTRALALYPQEAGLADLEIALPKARQGWQLGRDQSGVLILTDGPADAPIAFYRIVPDQRGKMGLDQAAAQYLPGADHAWAIISGTTSGAGLLRIDRDLNTWECAFQTGHDPECRLLAKPPMELSPVDMVAFDRRDSVLLTRDALWRLDRASRPVAQIKGPVISDQGQLLQNGGALLYWEGPGLGLWRIGEKAEQLFSQVPALRPVGEALAVLAGGKVSGLRDGRIVEVFAPESLAEADIIRSHFTSQGIVLALASGEVRLEGIGPVSDPLLRFSPHAVTVVPVPGAHGEWLEVAADGTLLTRFVGQCERPAPGPEPLAPEFIGPPPLPVTLPPIVEPCAQERAVPVQLGRGEVLMDLARSAEGALQILTERRRITLDASGSRIAAEDRSGLAETALALREAQPNGGFHKIAGRSFLNPPAIENGRITGVSEMRQLQLLTPSDLPEWDNGWISWRRDTRGIRFAGVDGYTELPLGEALVGGTFLPLQQARALRLPGGVVAWMSHTGLWQQKGERLELVLRQAAQPLPIAVDFGQFIAAQTRISALDGSPAAGQVPRTFNAGGIAISVDPVHSRVSAAIAIGGQPVSDMDVHGFLHDRRLSAAWTGGDLRLLTPVGIVSGGFLTGAVAALPDFRRLAAEGGVLLADAGTGWMQLAGGSWSRASEPFRNALLAEENGRKWERRDGTVEISADDAWLLARQGLDFDIDQLAGFAATPEVSVAITRAGTHAVPDYGGLRAVTAAVGAAPGGLPLDARRGDGGRSFLYTRTGLLWDGGSWRQAAQGERPWESRHAASLAGITIGFGPRPKVEVEVLPLGGGGAVPLGFNWARGAAMPFDAVTAFHADPKGAELLIGTRLGMRILLPGPGGYTNGPIIVPENAGRPVSSAVTAAGRPAAHPERIEIGFVNGDCATLPDLAAPLQACATRTDLSSRFVAADDFWRISKTGDSIRIAYLIDGQERALTLPMGGHMPHDWLSDRIGCKGILAERWHGGAILRIGAKQFDLPGLEGLYCLDQPAEAEGGGRLEPGLYALLPGTALRYAGNGFVPIGAAERDALSLRLSGQVVLETGRLRYGLEARVPVTDYLALSGNWIPTPWTGGRLALDQPKALAWRGDMQSVTGAGVVTAPGGKIAPANVRLMLGREADSLSACGVTRAEVLDGQSHGLGAQPDEPLRLYCRDGSWLEGVSDGQRDLGTFSPVAAAASRRVLISAPGLWSAAADYGPDGAPVSLSFTFRDEPARLSAGRFDFDSLQQIAAPDAVGIELLADSGWWRSAKPDLALAGTERPALSLDARSVAGFTLDLSVRSGAAGLCLTFTDGKAQFWQGGSSGLETTGLCREDRGRDPLWQWWQADDKPVATTSSLNGVLMTRQLTAGRFSDLVLSGSPLLTRDGGILVPGELGVLVLPANGGMPDGIYAFESEGSLTRSAEGDPVWLSRMGLTLLEGEGSPAEPDLLACPGLAGVPGTLPEGSHILRLQPGGADWAEARIETGAGPVQILVDCADTAQSRLWSHRRDVSGHTRSLSLGAAAISELQVSLLAEEVLLSDGLVTEKLPSKAVFTGLRGIAAPQGGDMVFVIDERQLIGIGLGPAISTLAAHVRATPSSLPTISDPEIAATVLPPDATPAPAPAPKPASARRVAPSVPSVPDVYALPSVSSGAEEPVYDGTDVQAALRRVLGRRIVADGVIGPRSRAAIAEWQGKIGSVPTGFLSQAQLALLLNRGAP
jgi:hypothetical protein